MILKISAKVLGLGRHKGFRDFPPKHPGWAGTGAPSHGPHRRNRSSLKYGLTTGYRKSFQVSNEGRPTGGGAGGGRTPPHVTLLRGPLAWGGVGPSEMLSRNVLLFFLHTLKLEHLSRTIHNVSRTIPKRGGAPPPPPPLTIQRKGLSAYALLLVGGWGGASRLPPITARNWFFCDS